ncbi:MAG: TfoX/Sxy family protein [Phenylobacterium sp.]|nr:TfoX/Sxy family protein [Phenylobacterium sp.]
MTMDDRDAIGRYEDLVEAFGEDPSITRPERRGFAQGALMRNGKLFATLRGETLLLKLPAARVAELIASGVGSPFDANKGRPMKEWVTVGDAADWLALTREAAAFVG